MSSRRLSPAEFQAAIKKGQLFDVLLLRGEETLLLEQACSDYVAKAMPEDAAEFDYGEYRAADMDAKTLWNILTTLPLMNPRRVIRVDISKGMDKDLAETLGRYVERPSPATTLILTWTSEGRTDGRGVSLGDSIVEVEFRTLKPDDRAAWARKHATAQGKRMDDEAIQYLIATSSNNLSDVAAKIEHAALYIGDSDEISVKVLMEIAGVTSEYTVFMLEDAILKGNKKEALRIAKSLLQGGESYLRLLGFHRISVMLLWQIARLLRKPAGWNESNEGRETWQSIRDSMGRKAFKLNDYNGAARRLGESKLRSAVSGLLDLEVRAKTGFGEPSAYFEWIWKICLAH